MRDRIYILLRGVRHEGEDVVKCFADLLSAEIEFNKLLKEHLEYKEIVAERKERIKRFAQDDSEIHCLLIREYFLY